MLIVDFNAEESKPVLAQFLYNYNAVNKTHQNTCYKSMNNPSCIDFIITNNLHCFQNRSTFCIGLCDFHELVVTVLKTSLRKTVPTEIHYRAYKKFNAYDFKAELRQNLATSCRNYENFEEAFFLLLDKHAPYKSKKRRVNQVQCTTKNLRNAIMKRSHLKTKYFKTNTAESFRLCQRHKNF